VCSNTQRNWIVGMPSGYVGGTVRRTRYDRPACADPSGPWMNPSHIQPCPRGFPSGEFNKGSKESTNESVRMACASFSCVAHCGWLPVYVSASTSTVASSSCFCPLNWSASPGATLMVVGFSGTLPAARRVCAAPAGSESEERAVLGTKHPRHIVNVTSCNHIVQAALGGAKA